MSRKESVGLLVFAYAEERLNYLQNNCFDFLEIDDMKVPFPGINVN